MRFAITGSKDARCVSIGIVDPQFGDDEGDDNSLIIFDRECIASAEGMEIMKDRDIAVFPETVVSGYDRTACMARYRTETKP